MLNQCVSAFLLSQTGQVIFLVFYLFSLLLVCILYGRARLTPPWLILTLGLSRRVHSIFMLRLFNDGVAMMVLYLAMWAMLSNKVCEWEIA